MNVDTSAKPFVFVTGPYRGGTPEETQANIQTAIQIGKRVFEKGYYPLVPHLTVRPYFEPGDQSGLFGYEPLMQYTLAMVSKCDMLLLIGHSPGADREWKEAERLRIPIHFDVEDLPDLATPTSGG